MKTLMGLTLFCLFSISNFAQEISNVSFEAQGNKIIIYYDLTADKDEEYEISLFLRREEHSGFIFTPQTVTGDVGTTLWYSKDCSLTTVV